MTPIHYTFKDVDLVMGIEEQRLIHELGWGLNYRERESLGETFARMAKRPDPTEMEQQPPRIGVTHCTVTTKVALCGAPHPNDMLFGDQFMALMRVDKKYTCASCVRVMVSMRQWDKRRPKTNLKVNAPAGTVFLRKPERVEHTDEQLKRQAREELMNTSTSYGDRSLEWGISVEKLKVWKRLKIITGPVGRIWNHWERPATDRLGRYVRGLRKGHSQSVNSARKIYHAPPLTDPTGRF